MRRTISFVLMTLSCACGASDRVPAAARAELAPGGTLRAGINVGNPVLAMRDHLDAEPRGVAVDVARALGRQLDVPVAFVVYESAAAMGDAAPDAVWDVAFLAADPARTTTITFSAPYVELEATYLVPAGSAIRGIDDVDAPGTRIAARPRSAYDLHLRRHLSHAQLVYPEGAATDLDLLAAGDADVLAGLRDVLIANASQLAGSRVLDGHFALMQQAIGIPKGRDAAADYVQRFVRDLKASGFIARALAETGARGARVAAAGP